MNIKTNYSGIYVIKNNITNEYYGGSSVNITRRWNAHKKLAMSGSKKCPILYNAMRKYGVENFSIRPVIRCSPEDLFLFEQRWLNKNVGDDNCYNLSEYADSPTRGKKLSEEHRNNLRKPKSISVGMGHKRGVKLTEQHKENIAKSLRGRKYNCDRRGQNAANSKLTVEQVLTIRQLYVPRKISYTKLASRFGVHSNTIKNIVKNYYWTNL